ncbi:RHS repeat-associated core domain-containing protein [Nonomuraea helvata]
MLVALTTLVTPAGAAEAAPGLRPHKPQQEPTVKVEPVPVRQVRRNPGPASPAPKLTLPQPGVAEIALTDARTAAEPAQARVGGLPVRISPAAPGPDMDKRTAGAAQPPGKVRIELLAAKGGLLLRLRRADGGQGDGKVRLDLDYGGFRDLYGADWASRLRLVELPACAVTTPSKAECARPAPVTSRNAGGLLSAEVKAAAQDTVYALEASPSGDTGDYRATDLSPSASWQVSTQTGAFTWSYPLDAPEVPGGLKPELAATYNSASVDGRIATSNNQASWLGEGWSLWSGSIERRYKSCVYDGPKTGDLCWGTDAATKQFEYVTVSFGGHSSELVYDAGKKQWRMKEDDGSRVDHIFGTANGDDDGEYWRITTPDGTQYHFGLNRLPNWTDGRPQTESAWTVPVYGNDAGEPCHAATFAASKCRQAYRWNLDYVVDPHGNTMTYYYAPETNAYGANMATTKETYTRGGTLQRIEYGTRQGAEYTQRAPARVMFTAVDRCAPGKDCAQRTAASWPDVPWYLNCEAATCPTQVSPTFWSTKRLTGVTTQILGGDCTDYCDVDAWTFDQDYPAVDDGTSPALWLKSVAHEGRVGGKASVPPVTFDKLALANRVDSNTDGLRPMKKYRVYAVNTESGGRIEVNYAAPECATDSKPTPDDNPKRCFPVRWTPEGAQTLNDWFHKYVVAYVGEVDRIGGNTTEYTSYDYEGDAGWAYVDDPLTPAEYRSWNDWRGYAKVRVRHGNPKDPSDLTQSATGYLYFRGLHGDKKAAGGTRTSQVTDSQGGTLDDLPQLAGFLREELTYEGVDGPVVEGSIYDPWQRGPTATQGTRKAYQVQVERTRTRTAIPGGWRRTDSTTTYDQGDMLVPVAVKVDDRGDVSTADDDRCTTREYARNDEAWLVLLSRERTVRVNCDTTPVLPRDAISDVLTSYDGGAPGQAPIAGDVTKTEHVRDYVDGEPRYVTVSQATYDGYGRVKESKDALGRRTATSYEPETGLPTSATSTNPLGHTATATLDPARNQTVKTVDANDRRTDQTYDPLGRLTGVWLPGRSHDARQTPNLRFSYGVRNDGATWVRTETLKANGNLVSSYELLDGFLRKRQTQAPSWGGGRILTDTFYDARGLVAKSNAAYKANGDPGTTLVQPADETLIPSQTVNQYDGAERLTKATLEKFNEAQWSTTTRYFGDHVEVTPPAGGTPTATYTDARGQTTELRQYMAAQPGGDSFTRTNYAYTRAGDLAKLTDAAGNVWSYEYDLRRNKIRTVDPDKGTSTMTYDDAGQLLTTTDARGSTVATVYDALGRKSSVHEGAPTGTKLASWAYDTLAKGRLDSSTRYDGGVAYTTTVLGYDPGYRPTGTRITIPDTGDGLAGTYETTTTYLADGSVDATKLPALGVDVPAETLVQTYDDLGSPYELTGRDRYVDKTGYTEFGEVGQIHFGDPDMPQIWWTANYDLATRNLSRSLVEREKAGALTVDDTTYAYDPAGNVTKIANTTPGDGTDVQCFGFDRLRRLTEAWAATDDCVGAPGSAVGGAAPYWTSYRYDVVSSRTSQTRHGLGGTADTVTTSTYPAPGRPRPHAPTSVTVTGPSGTKTDAFDYDAAGNTKSRPGGQALTWDVEGLLATVSSTGYVYTPDGNRLITRDSTGATLYLPSGEVRYNKATGKSIGTRYYTHGSATVAVRTGAGLRYLFADHHGTPDLAVDPATLTASKRRSDPFGAPRGKAPQGWPGSRGFVGGTQDASTGLTRLGARDYDTETGLFLSVDPVLDTANPQQFSAYAYSGNNPVTFSDPTGMLWKQAPDGECANGCGWKPGQGPASKVATKNGYWRINTRTAPDGECWIACRYKPGKGPASKVATKNGYWRINTRTAPDGECWIACRYKPGTGPASRPLVKDIADRAARALAAFREANSLESQATWVWDHISTVAGILGIVAVAVAIPALSVPAAVVTGVGYVAFGASLLSTGKDVAGCLGGGDRFSCEQAATGALVMGVNVGIIRNGGRAFVNDFEKGVKWMRGGWDFIVNGIQIGTNFCDWDVATPIQQPCPAK